MGLSHFETAAKERLQLVPETALHPSGLVATTGHDCIWLAGEGILSVLRGKGTSLEVWGLQVDSLERWTRVLGSLWVTQTVCDSCLGKSDKRG